MSKMNELTRKGFEDFLRENLPDVIRPRWEIKLLLEKAQSNNGRWRFPYYKWDAADLYFQMGELLLLQSKDEDFLKYCA